MPINTVNEAPFKYTYGLDFDYVDLQTTGFLSTLGAANQRIIGYLPPGGIVTDVVLSQVTDPAGATDLTIDVGITAADPDEFIDNGDVDGATQALYNTGDAFVVTATGATVAIAGYVNNTAAAVAIYMEFNGTVANLTAGAWKLRWQQIVP